MPDDEELEPRVDALEEQVRDLTGRLRSTEQDAAAARILAGAADRDVSGIQGDVRELRSEMQREFADVRSEMRREFTDVRGEMRTEFADVRGEMRTEFADVRGEMRTEFADIRGEIAGLRNATTASFNAQRQDFIDLRDHVDRGFAEMRGKFDMTAAGMAHLAGLIQTVIDNQGRSA